MSCGAGNNQGITVFAGGDGDNLTPATDRAFRLFFSRRERAADLLQHIDQIFGFAVFEIENWLLPLRSISESSRRIRRRILSRVAGSPLTITLLVRSSATI